MTTMYKTYEDVIHGTAIALSESILQGDSTNLYNAEIKEKLEVALKASAHSLALCLYKENVKGLDDQVPSFHGIRADLKNKIYYILLSS